MNVDLLVTTSKGLQELLADEIAVLCDKPLCRVKPGQVTFSGKLSDAYRLCLHARLANRVLLKLAEGKVDNADDLYGIAREIVWPEQFSSTHTFSVDFVGTNRQLKNTQFSALKIKDAIVDCFTELTKARPNVNKTNPDIRFQGRLWRDNFQLYLDLSGHSLHQRHYRQSGGEAPIKEHLACAMLMRGGWTSNTQTTLLDPMCGSGTLAIEAALIAINVAPGVNRCAWGHSYWRHHDKTLWQALLSEAQAGQVQSKVNIFASDIDPNAVKQARDNAAKAGVGELITFTVADATQLVAPDTQGYLVSNLPYGKRSGEIQRTSELMQEWGSWLKKHYAGWQLSLLNSQEGLLKQLKLIAKKEYALLNGNIPCYLNHYVLDERNCIEKPVLPVATDFVNRLDKNIKQLARWLATQDTNCYRLYDADLPDYNMAIDRYEDYLVVQEYAPPKWIKESKAQQRLQDAVKVLPKVLNIPSERIVVKQRRQQKGANQYAKLDKQNRTLVVFENRAKFRVNLWDYLDTGLFLDHRDTRQIIRTSVKGKKVLNLFCYTGSVSVFAALGGATSITSVDMSNTYLKWAESNFELNRLQGDYHFIQSDVLQWIEQCSQSYDFIFVDPPSFSNSKRMQQSWDVQRDHVSLLTQLADLLNKQGEMLFSTNLRQFKFDQNALGNTFSGMTNISGRILPQDFKRTPKIHQSWLLRKHAL